MLLNITIISIYTLMILVNIDLLNVTYKQKISFAFSVKKQTSADVVLSIIVAFVNVIIFHRTFIKYVTSV